MCHIVTRKPDPPDEPELPRVTRPFGPDDGPVRKERVIHTRVPESLEAELRRRAQSLGISVSNLVRNVLGHAFGLVGDVVADAHAVRRAAKGQAPRVDGEEIVAWQRIVLAKNAVCARCNAVLGKGKPGALGVTAAGPGPIVCVPCMEGEDS